MSALQIYSDRACRVLKPVKGIHCMQLTGFLELESIYLLIILGLLLAT